MVFREFLFFFALALTTYDALQNSPPRISDVPKARPFFDKGSIVTDWYEGELSKVLPNILLYDVSFVMYYAPWEAESQYTRNEFEKAAQIMFKHVNFAAINCWQPGSECRLRHPNIFVWPIIMVHTNMWKTLIYDGPKNYMSMVKFLQQVIKPITRLNSNDSLLDLISTCDAVVVGFIPIEPDSQAYNIFYNIALKKLEVDPFREICFGIVTSYKLALEMGVEQLPHVKLMLWNKTLEYPSSMSFNEDNISNWLSTLAYKHAAWVTPSWHKSTKMQGIFNYGPVLIMFSPRNLFQERVPNYDLLSETALEYNNCKHDPFIKKIINIKKFQRRKFKNYMQEKNSVCKDFNRISDKSIMKYQHSFMKNNVKNVWLNKTSCHTNVFDLKMNYFTFSKENYIQFGAHAEDLLKTDGYCERSDRDSCLSEFQKPISSVFNNYEILKDEDERVTADQKFETSMLDILNDPKSSVNLVKNYIKEMCANMDLAVRVGLNSMPNVYNGEITIEGLKCQTNHSLSFIAIDSSLNLHFAESLGIDIRKKIDRTAVVILDNKHETQYMLDKPLGEHSLREFIYNFTMNNLQRNFRSPIEGSEYTHFYGSDKEYKNNFSNNNNASGEIKYLSKWCSVANSERKYICINELNTSSFENFLFQKNKALLIVFCSNGVGSCGGLLTLTLLRIARSLWQISPHFEIARIDASINDLPWQYTVSKYPTLVFFPAKNKDNSRSYPNDKAITVEGLLAFILTGLETPTRLHAQFLLCNNTLDDVSMKKCLSHVRQSVVGLIGKMLRFWRRSQNYLVKNILLRRLQCLRTLAIRLGALNTAKVPLDNPLYKSFSDSVDKLLRIWRVVLNTSDDKKYSMIYDDL